MKKAISLLLTCLLLLGCLSGCGNDSPLDPKKPV